MGIVVTFTPKDKIKSRFDRHLLVERVALAVIQKCLTGKYRGKRIEPRTLLGSELGFDGPGKYRLVQDLIQEPDLLPYRLALSLDDLKRLHTVTQLIEEIQRQTDKNTQ